MRLVDGETCRRVYSYLRLDRAPHKCEEGFGIGVFAPGWDPMSAACGVQSGDAFTPNRIPGCQLWCETDTSRHLANGVSTAVVFPADPTVDGDMEAAGVAMWNLWQCTRAKSAVAPHSGAQCLVVNGDGANATGLVYSTVIPAGNCGKAEGWCAGDGVSSPVVFDTEAGALWTGTASTDWQFYSVDAGPFVGTIAFGSNTFVDAASYVRFDDATFAPRNVSQLTDLTGNGHHLLQATASLQPLWVPSGAGGYLSLDGVADFLKTAAFALTQPCSVMLLANWTHQAGQTRLLSGNAANTLDVINLGGADLDGIVYSGGGTGACRTAMCDSWGWLECYWNGGAGSYAAKNGGAVVTGVCAAANPGGVTLGMAPAAGLYAAAKVSAICAYQGGVTAADRQRLYRWSNRLRGRLAI